MQSISDSFWASLKFRSKSRLSIVSLADCKLWASQLSHKINKVPLLLQILAETHLISAHYCFGGRVPSSRTCVKNLKTYRNKWRVSSPYYASSINTFPTSVYNAFTFMKPIEKLSVIIRKDDWIKFDNVFKKDRQQINILWRKIRFVLFCW